MHAEQDPDFMNSSFSLCCGQLWVWHMFCGVGLWWVIPPNKIHGLYWNTAWVSIDPVDLCQTHCKQVPDISSASKSDQVTWSKWTNRKHCYLASSSSYLRVNMGCALAISFQVHSLYVPTLTGHLSGSVSGSMFPSLDYTQKSTRSTLALKLSVAPLVYLRVTATVSKLFIVCLLNNCGLNSKSLLKHVQVVLLIVWRSCSVHAVNTVIHHTVFLLMSGRRHKVSPPCSWNYYRPNYGLWQNTKGLKSWRKTNVPQK